MLIDWFTVVAQIVNFLVLVALLKHFLYGPLVEAMDAREKRIAAGLADAAQKDQEAARRCEQMRVDAEQMERDREKMLAEAHVEADRQHGVMLQKARDSVRVLEAKWNEDLEHEKAAMLDEIRRRAAGEILAITRRALADLACADLDECAIHAFLAKLQTVDPASLGDDVTLLSAADIPPVTQLEIEESLHHRFGERVRLHVEHTPNLAWGLELRSNGLRIGWNSETYMESLQENLRKALEHPG
jgi:F-type H+-transporting ATPase subunit b